MYNQLLYFVVALLLFTVHQPGARASFPPLSALTVGVGTFLGYSLICICALRRLLRDSSGGMPQAVLVIRYHRLQTRLSVVVLMTFTIYVYILNIKFYLRHVPFFEHSLALTGIIGLAIFLAHLSLIWLLSHPIYRRIHHSAITRAAFLKGQLGFSMAILVPWLLVSAFFDIAYILVPTAFQGSNPLQFAFYAVVLAIIVIFAPPLIVRLWGCDTLTESPLRAELEDFCRGHDFAVGDFKIWPIFGGEILTAGIVGILPRWRYILITGSLLRLLDITELKAVVAHEMGHVRRYHLLLFMFFFLCYSALSYSYVDSGLNDFLLLSLLESTPFIEWALADDSFHLSLFSLSYIIPVLTLLVVYLRFIFGFFLRNSERQADLYALETIGHPFSLISSLEKIALYSGNIHDLPSWHHFSIRQRVDFLLHSHQNRSIARKHHVKLYGATLVFVAIVGSLLLGGIHLKETKFIQHRQLEFAMSYLEKKIREQPENPGMYSEYGGLLLELGRYKEAEAALRKALEMDTENATTLNNLAWLYATAPPPHSNSEAALELSLEAAKRSQEPQVLDTLAEALFINGHYAEALDAITRALQKNPTNPGYFLRQKQKIEKAMEGSEQ